MNKEEKEEFKRIKKQSQEVWLDDDDIKFLIDSIEKLQKENEEWDRKFCDLQNLYFKLQDESELKRKEYQETYKDVREELKELKKENEILKEEKAQAWEEWNNLEQGSYEIEQRLKRKNEELKSKNKTLEELLQGNLYELYKYYKELTGTYQGNCIPVQKVKDKIEEIDEELEIMKVDNMYGRYKEYGGKTKWERLFATKYGMHDALQELLEGRK